jgi:cytochrome P450
LPDWAGDFDHLDPAFVENPYPIWDELHTERFSGVYLPLRYEDIRSVAYDPEHLSSRRIFVREGRQPLRRAPPITSDPPEHRAERKVLLPAFTPAAIQKLEPRTRALCRELLEPLSNRGGCDGAVDYAQEIPARVTAHMLGISEHAGDRFRKWIHEFFEAGVTDPAMIERVVAEVSAFFNQEIGTCLWHLATHADDRERLVDDPQLIPTAVEEFLRAYAPVTMAREIIKDTEIDGYPFQQGEMVMLAFGAANRDPAMFPDANRVIVDREVNRHAAFGLGIHRCIGSTLARMEMRVALEQWLGKFPDFALTPGAAVKWSAGTVRGPRQLPITLGPRRQ